MDQSPAAAAIRVAVKWIFGKWALISAVEVGDTKTVVDLLDGGVPIDTKDDEGRSLLHWAACGGHMTTMRLLIRRGCNVDSVDGRGGTPLHCAAAMRQTKAVRELIRNGATKSVVAGKCGTPLHQAALTGHVETAVAMLEEGCPLDVVTSDGETVLHFAAQGGNVELVRELADRGCDVNGVQANGGTPLHHAAGSGRTEAVCELIELGAAKSVVAGNYGTPLHLAAQCGHVQTAVAMLEEGCPLDIVTSDGATVLHFAAQGGNVELVRELADRGCDVNGVQANGGTPLHHAAGSGRTEAVCELIELGAAKSVVAGNYGTPLHLAAQYGHVQTAVAMLEEGCPLDIVTSDGATVLHFAAQGGNVELVRELVDRECDVNGVQANGGTPLHVAAAHGRTKAVHELIKLGATKSVVADNYGTPLHQAALQGHVDTAVAMLEEGCPLDIVTSDGATVLHFAAEGGNVELVGELVRRGCDVNAVSAKGCTPLHFAAGHGRTEAVHELIKLGATKSVVAGNCGTPLHQAAIYGHVETAVAMLEDGCPLDIVNSAGATVLHFAAKGGNVELVRELVGRGCDVNVVEADGWSPLHSAAGRGRTEAVRELIKLGAAKSVVAGRYGTPLHQAVVKGHVETVGALLEDGVSDPDLASQNDTPLKVQVLDSGIIGICDSSGLTPLMWAVLCGEVKVFKFLTSNGGSISDRDEHFLSVFEHCFVGGQASKLNKFCDVSGSCALANLITQGLVDSQKVLSLCAISGDSVFLEDQFTELVASDACAMPAAVKCVKYYFSEGEGVSFLNQLRIPDECTLNPLHISLLSLKCFEMGFAIGAVRRGTKDHTSFITKLLSHPVLKEIVCENLPNGLSPLDLARQFELHHIAALIEGTGGRPGVWADIPRDVFLSCSSELFTIYPLLKKVCDTSQGGHEAVKNAVIKFLGAQPVERSPPSVLAKELDCLWHSSATIVGADVGAERDDHAYKSLKECTCVDDVSDLVANCKSEMNAMLNHHEGGRIRFGIGSNGRVEEGLDFEQNEGIKKVREMVGNVLRKFWHPVDSRFAQVEPVYLLKSREELTGRWCFDIVVKRHPTVVQLARGKSGYYRHGATNVRMTYDVFVEKIRAESACRRGPKEATVEDGREPVWDANAAATVGANVGAERYDHEYKTLIGPVGDVKQSANDENGVVRRVRDDSCRRAINAMLNNPTGGSIHFGISDDGIVEEGLDPKYKSKAIDGVRKKVGEILNHFYHPVEVSFVQVEPVELWKDKQLTGRWRFDIVVKPHPTVVQLSQEETAYYRCGTQNQKMVHHVLAERVRREPAGQLPHGN